eukprot:CAMPEP_0172940604 /NCGR_PEP_ID=MMETSP1075-20121228/224120_1 /TAXON_ID=2916 /ORGANISM="Ceratium fusus, Strain PA161109" /LENGTH=350 /DNA_ID=CAMNT_0013802005 /DNA_START=60 /DNA_END=1109 /DNA_ORIENTATION=+
MNINTLDDVACFDGMGELMCLWAKCDAWLFNPGHTIQSMIPGLRKQAERFIRMLLDHHSAKEELGAALTLFDVLFSRAISPFPSFLSVEEVMDQASLAAIVRLVLKCSTISLSMGPSISDVEHSVGLEELGAALTLFDVLFSRAISPFPSFLSVEEVMDQASLAAIVRLVLKCSTISLSMGPSISDVEHSVGLGKLQKTGVIAAREVEIFTSLAGRVAAPSLPTPKLWLDSVLRRLEFLITPHKEQVAEFEQAMRGAEAATDLLTRSVGMSPFLPPRALALGGCVLGFITMGALSQEQARPEEVTSSLWDSVLVLWQGDHAKQGNPSTLGVDLDFLAAACRCSPSDLQVW